MIEVMWYKDGEQKWYFKTDGDYDVSDYATWAVVEFGERLFADCDTVEFRKTIRDDKIRKVVSVFKYKEEERWHLGKTK